MHGRNGKIGEILDGNGTIESLPDGEIGRMPIGQQINQILIVQFQKRHGQMIRRLKSIKNCLNGPGDDPVLGRIGRKGGRAHGIRLPCTRLAIGKEGDVISLVEGRKQGRDKGFVSGFLIYLRGEDMVERICLSGLVGRRGWVDRERGGRERMEDVSEESRGYERVRAVDGSRSNSDCHLDRCPNRGRG